MDFKTSFNLGLTAAAQTAAVIAEIDATFDELTAQILDATDGKISISRETRYDSTLSALIGFTAAISKTPTTTSPTTYVVATNPLAEEQKKEDLAEVSVHKTGYPCELRFGGSKYFCEDKKALEQTLSLMLADPDVGKKLNNLIKLKLVSDDQKP